MSSRTWTHDALPSEFRFFAGRCWRAVEAQARVSTLKLSNTLAEQAVLEDLAENTKPSIPPECRHLHYLLFTPFRYPAERKNGSRFRRPGASTGVFYASEKVETAMAEVAFYRLLFFAESPSTPWPTNADEYTAFSVMIETRRLLDLTASPLSADAPLWTSPDAYGACQAFADTARQAGASVIRYRSVRDPGHGANFALLDCAAFVGRTFLETQTWRVGFSTTGVRALCSYPFQAIEYGRGAFAGDPRIAALAWNR